MRHKHILFLLLFVLFSIRVVQAQISGPSTVCAGVSNLYSTTAIGGYDYYWQAYGGTIIGSSTSNQVTVQWSTTPQKLVLTSGYWKTIIDKWGDESEVYQSQSYTLNVSLINASAGVVTGQSFYCASVPNGNVISVSGNSGPVLRWEKSTNSGSTWTTISNTTVNQSLSGQTQTTSYRAVTNGACGLLYTPSFTVGIGAIPASPTTTSATVCGDVQAILTASANGLTNFRWYNPDGTFITNQAGSSIAVSLPIGTTTHSVSVLSVQGCESPRASVSATRITLPAAPAAPVITEQCGQTLLTTTASPSGFTNYWQTTFEGTSTSNSSPTFTALSSGTYYLRTRNNTYGCWGPSVAVTVNVTQAPTTIYSGMTIQNECRKAMLFTPLAELPAGTSFYWQTLPNGTSTANKGSYYGDTTVSPYTVNQSGKYYLRSRIDRLDCWGPASDVSVTVNAQQLSCLEGQHQNFIVTNTLLKEGVLTESEIENLKVEENAQQISYVDGFGRPIQHVIVQGSPTKQDIVSMMTYDLNGRENKKYLPFTFSNDGRYKTDPLTNLQSFYQEANAELDNRASTSTPWAETVFENSALVRVKEQGLAGEPWQIGTDKTIKSNIRFNTDGEVRLWQYDYTTGESQSSGYYVAGELIVNEAIDEDGNKSWSYSDKQGRVVLSTREVGDTEQASTYYVFDSFSQIRMVIQPEGVKELLSSQGDWTPRAAFISKWCFTYKYDKYGRVAEKQVPAAEPVFIIYNKRHQPVLTQDGEQRKRNEWSFTKYDGLQRVVVTGIYRHDNSLSQAQMQQLADAYAGQFESRTSANYATQFGFTLNQSFPLLTSSNSELYSIHYYDDYNFDNDGDIVDVPYTDMRMGTVWYEANGKATGTRIKVLGTNQLLLTITYYDKRGRVLQLRQQNHLGGEDLITNRYDFTGKVWEAIQSHQISGSQPVVIKKWYDYDHGGRLLSLSHQTNDGTVVTLSRSSYNELGQQINKKLHSTDQAQYLQDVDYRYNIHGSLTHINDAALSQASDLFGMELQYENATINPMGGKYNGNISGIAYRDRGMEKQKSYSFTYDKSNQLKAGEYVARSLMGGTSQVGAFNEELSYDLNGNIKSLQRHEFNYSNSTRQKIDDLTYGYSGNQLLQVQDEGIKTTGFIDGVSQATEYSYDANGRMTEDQNKGLNIFYNNLNLVDHIEKGNGGSIRYTYDASGKKLNKVVTDSIGVVTTRNYVSGFEYNNENVLEHFPTEEGRVVMHGTTAEYQYNYVDHLGNVRLTFTSKPETEQSTATLETAAATTEQSNFLYYDEAVKLNHYLFDHTRSGATNYSTRLSGTVNERTGLARSISVMPGDKIHAEVYAKFLDVERTNWTQALASLMQSITSGTAPAGTVVDGGLPGSTGGTAMPFADMTDKSGESGNSPKAYLNYLVFNIHYVLLKSGYVRVSENAREYGQNGTHEKLTTQVTIDEPGYAYFYLSNDNAALGGQPVEVYFDDFTITQTKSLIVQSEEYYPFGQAFNSYTRENAVDQKYLYNGKELQNELSLNWLDYGARMYDPLLARWSAVDPLAEKYAPSSPYNYVVNNSMNRIDPDGRDFIPVGSEEFKRKYKMVNDYLARHGADGYLRKVESMKDGNGKKINYYVYEAKESSHSFLNYIYWNPTEVIVTTSGYKLSPAEALNHEAAHKLVPDEVTVKYGPVGNFDNPQDAWVITGPETDVAIKLGKLKLGQVTRTDHSYKESYPTDDPTSTIISPAYLKEKEKRKRNEEKARIQMEIESYQWPGMTFEEAKKKWEEANKASARERTKNKK